MSTWEAQSNLAKSVKAAGFLYDQAQDIIYSKHDAWQRGLGYCWGYDVASSGIRVIIDCETIYFDYNGSAWMIELWKGQYGLETGAEIGVCVHAQHARPVHGYRHRIFPNMGMCSIRRVGCAGPEGHTGRDRGGDQGPARRFDASQKFQNQASAVARKRASEVAAAAYRDIASFFDGRLWHVTREARNLS